MDIARGIHTYLVSLLCYSHISGYYFPEATDCFIPVSYCHCKTMRSLSAVYSVEDFLSSHLGCQLLELGFEMYLVWRIGSHS